MLAKFGSRSARIGKSVIIVVTIGAGVFGLSSALHLTENGYTDILLLDGQKFDANGYLPWNGADSASSDTRKVIRAADGKSGMMRRPPPLFVNCGWARLNEHGETIAVEVDTLETMQKLGLRESQYRLDDTGERARAVEQGWSETSIDPFHRISQGLPLGGVFDSLTGFARAADTCAFVLNKIKQLGVRTLFGSTGRVAQLLYSSEEGLQRAIGVRTANGEDHLSDVVIVAAGAYTHELIPGLDDTVTAAAGSIVHVRVPAHLQERFGSDRFPVTIWNYTETSENGSFSIFPLDEYGTLKFLYGAPQWRNISDRPDALNQRSISLLTSWSFDQKTNVPTVMIDKVKEFISEYIPELTNAEIILAKLCWDAVFLDKEFMIDWLPGVESCMIITGGSNHGFKFLPTLGKYVLKILGGKPDPYTRLRKCRAPSEEESEAFKVGNLAPARSLNRQTMTASAGDLGW
ncbi:sarcosine oxidase [Aspergillus ellipticus CBS 707.79]|uniref:Sarcosine oxidase n=1 Tax=Aspergillus ellipticus CBS 707.79 TaxID=1448320 RepID=A0A319EPQ8_9EURO|nr:sarcosine oxidase [Aspergillus ellipticus CBS 707.79]